MTKDPEIDLNYLGSQSVCVIDAEEEKERKKRPLIKGTFLSLASAALVWDIILKY